MSELHKDIGIYGIDLPSRDLPNGKRIYVFDMASNFKFSRHVASILHHKIMREYEGPRFDLVICAESKGVILGTIMADIHNCDLLVLRKEKKPYYDDLVSVVTDTYTTDNPKSLYIPEHELMKYTGKNALFVDDVISTGSTSKAIVNLCECYSIHVAHQGYIFSEGSDVRDPDQTYLETLPVENI